MAKDVGFENKETYNSTAKGDRIDRYTAETGRRDIIRIVSTCLAHMLHWMQDRRKYIECGLDEDGGGVCLVCQQTDESGEPKYPAREKYGCLVVLVASKKDGGEWVPINKVMYWGFGGDKYRQLFELRDEFGDVKQLELMVTCSDSKLQKLNFMPWTKGSMLDTAAVKAQAENAKKWLKIMTSPSKVEKQREILGMEPVDDGGSLPAAITNDVGQDDDPFADAGTDPAAEASEILGDLDGFDI